MFAEIVEKGRERRELAANAGRGQCTLLELPAPSDDVGAGNAAQFGDAAQAHERDEFRDIDLVGPVGFGIGEVGEPFELGRNLGEIAEMGRR
jgi:hypothetical protein